MAEVYQDRYLLDYFITGSTHFSSHDHVSVEWPVTRSSFERFRDMTEPFDVGFHAQPFRAKRFPGTSRHVLVAHGIDSGRYDDMGSFSFGPGRLLSSDGSCLYDYLLVSSPWSVALAEDEVPQMSGRVLLAGDGRADRLLQCANRNSNLTADTPRGRPTIGLATGHGSSSSFRMLSQELVGLIADLMTNFNVVVAFHPYERRHQPELWQRVLSLEAERNYLSVAKDESFEESLASCDLLVCDYSSTSLYYSLLKRPIAYTPFDSSVVYSHFPLMELRRALTCIQSANDIRAFAQAFLRGEALPTPSDDFVRKLYPPTASFAEYSPAALGTILNSPN